MPEVVLAMPPKTDASEVRLAALCDVQPKKACLEREFKHSRKSAKNLRKVVGACGSGLPKHRSRDESESGKDREAHIDAFGFDTFK